MIPQFLIARFGPQLAKVIFFCGLLLLVVAIVGGIYLAGSHAGKSGEVVKEQARTIDTQKKVGAANDNAAAARVESTQRQEQQRTELTNAINNASSGDDARRRNGCAVLRQQGRDVSSIPACR